MRTFQRYTKTIYEEDKQVWYDITSQELESELLRLRSCLNNSYNIAKKMAEDESADIGERLEACQAANDCRLSLVQILREYPIFIKTSIATSGISQVDEQDNTIIPTTLKRVHS